MILWDFVFGLFDPIIMFDICKVYPIWIPPCRGDVWDDLNRACRELSDVAMTKFAAAVSDLSEALRRFNMSTKV